MRSAYRLPVFLLNSICRKGVTDTPRAIALVSIGLVHVSPAYAQTQGAAQDMSGGMFLFNTLYFFALVYLGYYFMIVRPRVREEQERTDFVAKLKRGDDVVTTGGIYGRVATVQGDGISIEIDKNVRIRVRPQNILPVKRKEGGGAPTKSLDTAAEAS